MIPRFNKFHWPDDPVSTLNERGVQFKKNKGVRAMTDHAAGKEVNVKHGRLYERSRCMENNHGDRPAIVAITKRSASGM